MSGNGVRGSELFHNAIVLGAEESKVKIPRQAEELLYLITPCEGFSALIFRAHRHFSKLSKRTRKARNSC